MSQRTSGGSGYKNSNLNSALSKQQPSSSSSINLPRYNNGLVPLGVPKRSRSTPTSSASAAKLAVPKPVNLPSLRKENAGNDPSTQIVPSGGGGSWQKPEEQQPAPPPQQTSALTAGSNWASGSALRGDGPAPWQPPDLAFPVAPSLPARDRRLNPREYPSLSAAAASRQANVLKQPVPSVPDTSAQRTGKWDEDERQLPAATLNKTPSSDWAKERGFDEEERFSGSVWGDTRGGGGERDWRSGGGPRGGLADVPRYGEDDRWGPGAVAARASYPPLAPRRFDGPPLDRGYDRFHSAETDYVGYGAVDDPVLFPPIGPPRPPPPPPRDQPDPDVLKETDAEKEAFLAELDRVAAELEKEKQRKKEEREAKLAEEAAAAAEAEAEPPKPVREPPQTAAQAVVVGVVIPPSNNEPAAPPENRPETAAEARARAAAVRRAREEAEEEDERKRKEAAAAKLRMLEERMAERRRIEEEAKQKEEEEARKRQEEEEAAAAVALAAAEAAKAAEAPATGEQESHQGPIATDDTELAESFRGSSIDVRATSSVAQDHITTSDDESGPEAGSSLRSLPSAASSVSEAVHLPGVSAWDKPLAPVPNGLAAPPRGTSPIAPRAPAPAPVPVAISAMYESGTDAFVLGPDAIGVSITEEILSEAPRVAGPVVAPPASMPPVKGGPPQPMGAPVSAAPPAAVKPVAATSAPMSWRSIVTGQEEPVPPPQPEASMDIQAGNEGRGQRGGRGRGRDKGQGRGPRDGDMSAQADRSLRGEPPSQRVRDSRERGPRANTRGGRGGGPGSDSDLAHAEGAGRRPPRQRGPKGESRGDNAPLTPTGSDASAPQRGRGRNTNARVSQAPGAPPAPVQVMQAPPRATPVTAAPPPGITRPPMVAGQNAAPGNMSVAPLSHAPQIVQEVQIAVPQQQPVVHAPVAAPAIVPPPPPPVADAGWGQRGPASANPRAFQAWNSYNPQQAAAPREPPPGILSPTLDPPIAPRTTVSDSGDGANPTLGDRAVDPRLARPASAGSSAGFDGARPNLPSDLVLTMDAPPHTQTGLPQHPLGLGLHTQSPVVGGGLSFTSQFGFPQQPLPQGISQVWQQPAPPPQAAPTSTGTAPQRMGGLLSYGLPGPAFGHMGPPPPPSHLGGQQTHPQPQQAPPPPSAPQQAHHQAPPQGLAPPLSAPQPTQQRTSPPFAFPGFGGAGGVQFGQLTSGWEQPFVQTGRAPDWSNPGSKGVNMGGQGSGSSSLHNSVVDAVVSGPGAAYRHGPPGIGLPSALGQPPPGPPGPPGLQMRGQMPMSPITGPRGAPGLQPAPTGSGAGHAFTQLDLPEISDISSYVNAGANPVAPPPMGTPPNPGVSLPDDIFSPQDEPRHLGGPKQPAPGPGRMPNGTAQGGRRGGPQTTDGGRRGRGNKAPGGRNDVGRGMGARAGRGGRGGPDAPHGMDRGNPMQRSMPRENGPADMSGGPPRGGGDGRGRGRARGDRGRAPGGGLAGGPKTMYVAKASPQGGPAAGPSHMNGAVGMANGNGGE